MQKPSKKCFDSPSQLLSETPDFLVAIQPYQDTQTTPNGVLLQAKVAGANETLQAHTYGEVRAFDNKKHTGVGPGPLDLDRWTVVKFCFCSDPSNGGDVVLVFGVDL